MLQAIGILLFIVMGKLLWDHFKLQEKISPKRKKKNGQVIDVSDAWIDPNDLPYRKKEQILSGKDLALYMLVIEILEDSKYLAFPRIKLADILSVPMESPNAQEYINRIKDRNVELIIFEKPELKPKIAIIALNANEIKRKQINEQFLKNVLESSAFPFIPLNLSSLPDREELKNELVRNGLVL